MRERSAADIVGIGFDGYAIGGLSVGEERGAMLDTVAGDDRRCCRPTGRATSWASAIRTGCWA